MGTPWAAWLVLVLWGVTVGVILVLAPGSTASPGSAISTIQVQLASIFGFSLKLFFALHACRFFVDARRDGTLELLLCTPLSNQDIIQGQMKALWRSYRWPVIVLLALLFLPLLLRLWSGAFQLVPGPLREAAASTVLAGVFALRMGADVLAILWFGTALALTSRRPSLAPAWTVLFVLVLPAPLSFCWLGHLLGEDGLGNRNLSWAARMAASGRIPLTEAPPIKCGRARFPTKLRKYPAST